MPIDSDMRTIYINATNTFQTRAKTGIQRAVRELGRRLSASPGYHIIVLHEGELRILRDRDEMAALLDARAFTPRHRIAMSEFRAGDIFFDIDASWGDPCRVIPLWLELKQRGCILVKMHYDAVPILFPQYSHADTVYRYIENFSAALRYMDYWVCNSNTVERDLHRIVHDIGMGGVSTRICPLGADIHVAEDERPPAPFVKAAPGRYILSVGTIEPRKNYELVLDVFESLIEDPDYSDVHLVIVGKSGWNNQVTIDRIRKHPEADRRLHWFAGISDAELEWLYRGAQLCLCLSRYEGFGLPVIEALSRGVPVMCTRDSAMDEVAGGAAIAVALDRATVTDALKDFFRVGGRTVTKGYRAMSWDEAAGQMHSIFSDILDMRGLSTPPHQVVYISVRPSSLQKSLQSVERYMSFINEAVILTSDEQFDAMNDALRTVGLRTTLLKEGEIGLYDLPIDHLERNTLLRSRLYAQDLISDDFIACDDDYQAIQPLDLSVFMEAGRHKAYFFYEDGREWLGAAPPTSFDVGIWKTTDFLHSSGFDTRLYNAHQPQIINKRLALIAFERTRGLGCDEWSSYFNIAKHLSPGMIEDVVYRAAGWPENGAPWLPSHCPTDTLFFNDLPDCSDPMEAARAWRLGLLEAMAQAALIQPRVPCLVIESCRVGFSEHEITCPAGHELCIPLLSDCDLERIHYSFLNHDVNLVGDIPNFLHVPIRRELVGQTFELKATASFAGQMLAAKLKIGVIDPSP